MPEVVAANGLNSFKTSLVFVTVGAAASGDTARGGTTGGYVVLLPYDVV